MKHLVWICLLISAPAFADQRFLCPTAHDQGDTQDDTVRTEIIYTSAGHVKVLDYLKSGHVDAADFGTSDTPFEKDDYNYGRQIQSILLKKRGGRAYNVRYQLGQNPEVVCGEIR